MALKTFAEQVNEHITFLRSNGFDVEALEIDAGFVRCHALNGSECGRGEYAYQTKKNSMRKPSMVGLVTWCRGTGGNQLKHSTYGQDGEVQSCMLELPPVKKVNPVAKVAAADVERKARYLWDKAKKVGQSDYLERKGVGSYGIRFLENQYGRVAVIPVRDEDGILRNLQFLNPDGFKPFLKDSKCAGLFHKLREPINGQDIGVAESYVTSATCLELSGIPMICAFSSGNLPAVAKKIRIQYPESRIVIFADNDRHHEKNVGIEEAEKALALVGPNSLLAFPAFDNIAPNKDSSDWNDLVRMMGKEVTRSKIMDFFDMPIINPNVQSLHIG